MNGAIALRTILSEDYFKEGEGEVFVNIRHPQVRPAIKALQDLRQFAERKATPDFIGAYENEHKDEFSFESRSFWERHLY
jgi:hypothetical protein